MGFTTAPDRQSPSARTGCPDPLGDSTLDLSPRLHRVDDRAGVEGLHALKDADLAGDAMHGDPKAMRQERRGSGRPYTLRDTWSLSRNGDVREASLNVIDRSPHCTRPSSRRHSAAGTPSACWPHRADSPARPRRPYARPVSPRWCPCWRTSPCRRAFDRYRRSPWRRAGTRVEHGGGDLPLRVADAVAEFGGPHGKVVGAIRQQ